MLLKVPLQGPNLSQGEYSLNYKALSLVCAVGLSSLLFSGCGINDDRNNVTTQGLRGTAVNNANNVTGFKPRGGLNYEGSSLAYDMRGTPMNGTGTYANRNAGTDANGTGLGTGVNRSGIAGYGAYGTTGIHRIPAGIAARRTAGYRAGMNRTDKTGAADTLVLGDTVIVSREQGAQTRGGGRAAGFAAYGTAARMNRANAKTLVVTDKHAVKALKRVKTALKSPNAGAKAERIGADIRYILKHASPMAGR
jgi:hypothetical protein